MDKVKVLFFSADPKSAPPHGHGARLLLEEEVREIQEKVRTARYRGDLAFDARWATRTDDLLLALNETDPQVVHFSGHGGSGGLVMVGSDPSRPHSVDAGALVRLFRVFRGDIRVVVLNACFSRPQAEAIADVVGCAIGTSDEISDPAAIIFSAAFYRAIAFGHSVAVAFEQARTALDLEHLRERDYVELVLGPGVDASRLFVVPPGGLGAGEKRTSEGRGGATDEGRRSTRGTSRARMTAGGIALVGAVAIALPHIIRPPVSEKIQLCNSAAALHAPTAPVRSSRAGSSGVRSDLDLAKVDYEAGRYAAAFPRFRKLAQSGNLEAMGFVGVMFLRGQGIGARPDSAAHYLRKAAYQRDLQAMTVLASAYQDGDGVTLSRRWAKHWYRQAADEKHSVEAMNRLGALYLSEQNYDSALIWFENAVKAGSLDAWTDAGQMYEQGQGTPQDLEAAFCVYRTAAEAGSLPGMLNTGRVYEKGIGVDRDYEEAAKWYRKAAAEGSAGGMRSLGELYRHGLGVPRDTALAELWFRRAVDAGRRAEDADRAARGAS